jgi:ParB family chromosome partitioning protein
MGEWRILTYSINSSQRLVGKIEYLREEDIRIPQDVLRNLNDASDIEELAKSIYTNGLLQPIVVRYLNEYFEVIAGCRRYLACKILKWEKIPCCIADLDDIQAFELSLVENIERKSLSPLEEGAAYKKYIDDKKWGNITKLAFKIGKSPSYITKRISLLSLPADVQKKILESSLSPSTAEELLPLGDTSKQSYIAAIISEKNLPLKRVRKIVKDHLQEQQISKEESIKLNIRKIDRTINSLNTAMDKIALLAYEEPKKPPEDRAIVSQSNFIVRELLLHTVKILNDHANTLSKLKRKYTKQVTQ